MGASVTGAGIADNLGLDMAPEFYAHYLAGKGQPKILDVKRVRSLPFIERGEEINRKRFEDDVRNPDSPLGQAFNTARKSGYATLDDSYQVVAAPGLKSLWRGTSPGLDAFLATGTSELNSRLVGSVRNTGDALLFRGGIQHTWGDIYGFNNKTSLEKTIFWPQHKLKEWKDAEDYLYGSAWEQGVTIYIPLSDVYKGHPIVSYGNVFLPDSAETESRIKSLQSVQNLTDRPER